MLRNSSYFISVMHGGKPKMCCRAWTTFFRHLASKMSASVRLVRSGTCPLLAHSYSTHSSRRVVVTGLGLVTPLGVGTQYVWREILGARCGITKLPPEFSGIPSQVGAVVPRGHEPWQFDENLWCKPSERKTIAPATLFAAAACEEALTDAKWKPTDVGDLERTGVAIGGCSVMAVKDIIETAEAFSKGYNKVQPYFIPRILTNMISGFVSIKYGFQGPNHSASTACTTGLHAIGDSYRFIKYGDADVMVCGGADASIEPVVVAGFARMRALSTDFNETPEKSSRPFDKDRDGFVIGEGSGVVVLEEYEHAVTRGANIYAEILGYGLSGDGYHISTSRPDGIGAARCMRAAVKEAGISLEDVTYINAHATSTPTGDRAECIGIRQLFGEYTTRLAVSSTKGATGHLLGAAGSVEAIFTILACNTGHIPPTINMIWCEQEIRDCGMNLVPLAPQDWSKEEKRRIALTSSFGFGGTNSSLCIADFDYH